MFIYVINMSGVGERDARMMVLVKYAETTRRLGLDGFRFFFSFIFWIRK